MTKAELKIKLNGAKYYHQIINEKTIEVKKLKDFVDKISSHERGKDTVQQNNESKHRMAILDALENEEESLCMFMLRKKAIENMINLLPQPYNLVLYLRYVSCEAFKQIGNKMNYSEKRIYQLHDIALNLLLEEEWQDNTLDRNR